MTTLLIATRNAHKVQEIRTILGADFNYLSLQDFPDAPAVVEDADTFAGNAAKKALEIARWLPPRLSTLNPQPSTVLVLADDSGLEVDALGGAPGVYSARFAALTGPGSGNCTDTDNNAKLLNLLRDVPWEKRTARFRCVIALATASPDAVNGPPRFFEGACEGRLEFAPRGHGGFGYDPLFIPDGFQESFAELGGEAKNKLSHRAKALAQLRAGLKTGGSRSGIHPVG